MYPYIYIPGLDVELPTYGLCALLGALTALIVCMKQRKKTILSEDNILDGFIFALLFGLLGAKILYLIKDPPIFPLMWDDIKEILTTGLVFYGGLIGGIGGLALAALKTKKPFLTFTDTIVPAFCFAHAWGRIGCLLAGCCYGVEMEGFLCIQLGGTERLAVQLMEAVFLVLLGLGLSLIRRRKLRRGTLTGLYMVLYAVWRFTIEFWRDDDRGFVGALSTSQFLGIFIFAAGILILFMAKKYNRPTDRVDAPVPEEPGQEDVPDGKTEESSAEDAPEGSAEAPLGIDALISLAEEMPGEERANVLSERSGAVLTALMKHTGDEKKARELFSTYVLGAVLADNRLSDEEYPLVVPMLKSCLGEETDAETCRARLAAAEDKTALLRENNDLLLDILGEEDPALKRDCVLVTLLIAGVDKDVSPEERAYIEKLLA